MSVLSTERRFLTAEIRYVTAFLHIKLVTGKNIFRLYVYEQKFNHGVLFQTKNRTTCTITCTYIPYSHAIRNSSFSHLPFTLSVSKCNVFHICARQNDTKIKTELAAKQITRLTEIKIISCTFKACLSRLKRGLSVHPHNSVSSFAITWLSVRVSQLRIRSAIISQ